MTQPHGCITVVNANRVDFDREIAWAAALGAGVKVFHDVLGSNPTDDEIVARAEGADVVVTKEIRLSETAIARLPPSVKLICEAGTGYNNIDRKACQARGITICNVPCYSEGAVASLVLTFILSLSCGLVAQQKSLVRGDCSHFTRCLTTPHFEVAGKTLGLVGGTGSIGSKVAKLARAHGMQVIISTRRPPLPGEETDASVRYTASVDELLRASDFVSLHCPLTEDTKRLIGAEAISTMKPSAYLINTARGPIVDEEALCIALRSGAIAGAALDVQENEPPVPESPLWECPNLILTPHIGWKRIETRRRLVEKVAANIAAFRAGAPINIVG